MRSNVLKGHLVAVAVASALGMASLPALAGESTGTVNGVVVHAPAANLKAVIKSESTGQTRTVDVSQAGTFKFPQLQVGRYKLQIVDASGSVLKETELNIGLGASAASLDLAGTGDVERISVVGSAISMVNTTSVDSGLNIGEAEFDKLPVGRDSTSIAMLAPGTVKGDSAFGNLAAFGGASVAENAYYINGLNVTNFRNGLGGSSVPFEFYDQFKVKTGGYSAEFGRSLGGVIDAVTKSGGNEFEAGANYYYSPDSLRTDKPNTRFRNGKMYLPNDKDKYSKKEANIWASGPIIKDKLFFYALFNPRNIEQANLNSGSSNGSEGGTSYTTQGSDNSFWGTNIDWYITDKHFLEFTAFNDKNDTKERSYGYDYATGKIADGDSGSLTTYKRGGKNWSLKYTGYITDDLTISALYGKNKYDLSDISANAMDCPYVVDVRPGVGYPFISCAGEAWNGIAINKDERTAYRFDVEWTINDHHTLRLGYDNEDLDSFSNEFTYSGGVYYRYFQMADGQSLGDAGYTNSTGGPIDVVRARHRTLSGSFKTKSKAYYIEDQWQINDELFASIGLRNDSFENDSVAGNPFIKVDNQWAPRLGISWDIGGQGTDKLYANYGLYYLPIANNTSARVAGTEEFTADYYMLNGVGSDGLPVIGDHLGNQVVYSDGAHPEDQLADANIKPMYQEEWILGYEKEFMPSWTLGIRGTHRELKRAIDDNCSDILGGACTLINPGYGATIGVDTNGDGLTNETRTYTAEEIGLPKAKRLYDAVSLELNHRASDLVLSASYTWSHLRGNAEGYVKSDNGQTDAGITTDWDFPALMDGAFGDLPNDRRHVFKFYGAYSITDDWSAGWNFSVQSGRPINAFGIGYPDALGGQPPYGDTYYTRDSSYVRDDSTGEYQLVLGDYVKRPRGSMGRTPWTVNLDLSTAYNLHFDKVDVKLTLDVFNVLDAGGVTEVFEVAEADNPGTQDPRYGLATNYQAPRSVRLGAEVKF
ncbi:TonB-dependent receptor [Gallaecimonas kandeliae]|uniref:TonB-dependent receptor n=1 Tax=Gallaecimonas kandeliae TaxID=3029055 RepID=UPI002648C130|nr:TonB-dependent receptor [Gallaecimonas kandeliae]WKE65467.1 TonB-dependent receptor [Gallaecimonas kandeliae]